MEITIALLCLWRKREEFRKEIELYKPEEAVSLTVEKIHPSKTQEAVKLTSNPNSTP